MLLKSYCNLTSNVRIYFKIAILFSCQHFQLEVFSVYQCWMEKCASNFPFNFENRTKTNNIHKLFVVLVNFVESYLQQQRPMYKMCNFSMFNYMPKCIWMVIFMLILLLLFCRSHFSFLFLFVFVQKIKSVHLSYLFIYTMTNINCLWNEFEFVVCWYKNKFLYFYALVPIMFMCMSMVYAMKNRKVVV